MNKDEYAFLPEAFFGGVQEQEDEEELDPYFRPDAVSGEDEPDGLDWLPETPTEPCPCCGAEIPENPSWGYICPMCGWEIDYDVEGEPDKAERPESWAVAHRGAVELSFVRYGRTVENN